MTLQVYPHRTPQDVKEWCEKATKAGVCPEFPEWPKTLFGLGKDAYFETIEYIMKRFRETEDMTEYYCCIPYLYKDITAEELFVPWSMSPNFQRLQEGNTNIAPKNKPSNCIPKVPTKYGQSVPKPSMFGSDLRRV